MRGGLDVASVEEQITDALAELRGARLDHQHCPSQDNAITVEGAERRLNRLLDRRAEAAAQ